MYWDFSWRVKLNIEEKPFESLAMGLDRDLSSLLEQKPNQPNRGTLGGVLSPLGANLPLGMASKQPKPGTQEPLESLSDRFAQQIAVFPISKHVVINKFGAYVPQALFGLETEIAYRQLANPDGTINVTIHPRQSHSAPPIDQPFPIGDSGKLIMFKSKTKSHEANSYPLRGAVIKYEAPTEPVDIEDWDALK